MSAEKTEAIVLRLVPWSETSLIVTLWTRDFGKLSAIAKGARRPKSPFESALDLLAQTSVVFYPKSGDVLDLLTEAKLVRRFRSAQRNLASLYCGYYVAELLLTLTEEGSPVPELYELTCRTLVEFDRDQDPLACLLRFEWHLLRLLGHMPNLENCVGCGGEIDRNERIPFGIEAGGILCRRCLAGQRQILRLQAATIDYLLGMTQTPWETMPSIPIDVAIRRELRGLMNRYFSSLTPHHFALHPYLQVLERSPPASSPSSC